MQIPIGSRLNLQVVFKLKTEKRPCSSAQGTHSLPHHFSSLAADPSGNILIADSYNCCVRKLSPNGTVSTVAGAGRDANGFRNGKVEEALFGPFFGIAVGKDGAVYVSDYIHNVIRKISDGVVSTLAGKPGASGTKDGKGYEARFNNPQSMCVDSDGCLLVIDVAGSVHSVRRVTQEGVVTTLVGKGTHKEFDQGYFSGICSDGDDVYVADNRGNCVWKISLGSIVPLRIDEPLAVTFFNGSLYTSNGMDRILRGENFEHYAGTGQRSNRDGILLEASFFLPLGMVAANGGIYVADKGNNCIRKIHPFAEWSPSIHQQTNNKWMRGAVKTVMLMRRRSDTPWSGVPRDILFLICAQLFRFSTSAK